MDALLIQDHRIVQALCSLFDSAHDRIIILQYQFRAPMRPQPQMQKILKTLRSAAARGVQIYIVLNKPDRPRRPGPGHGALPKFLNHENIHILHHTRQQILHIKAASADNHSLILGSHNMSQSSFSNSRNLSVLITAPTTIQDFLTIAKTFLDGATNGTS